MPKLGNFIRIHRNELGLTQAALAEKLHVTDKAVSKWERDLSYPDISLFPKLADIFGVGVSDLLRAADGEGSPAGTKAPYRVSHDVRTPIHIIMGCADLADRYADDPEKRRHYLDMIHISAEFLLERCEQMHRMGGYIDDLTPVDLSDYYRGKAGRPDAASCDLGGRRILVAEDMELNREIAGEIMRETGAEVEFAEDGEVCLNMINSHPPKYYDLILMDISMPGMDGIEATRRIRQLADPDKSNIPIVAMTANTHDSDRRAAFEAGMNGFAEKPVDIGKLCLIINKLI